MIMQTLISFIDLIQKLIIKIKSRKENKTFLTIPEIKLTTTQSKINKE